MQQILGPRPEPVNVCAACARGVKLRACHPHDGKLTFRAAAMSASAPEPPDHDELARALAAADADFSAAEVHGTLTGLLCAGADERAMPALARLLPEGTSGSLGDMLGALLRQARAQLQDPEFGFALLLPGEEVALDAQVSALADWCRGFIVGLTAGGVAQPTRLPSDAGEVVADFARIAATEVDVQQAAGEEEERQLAELVEYVRVGVQLVFEQLRPAARTRPRGPR
jgi:hypothetical protein